MHSLLQAVRDVNNRHCAECESQIGDISSAYAVLDFGVWVCKDCSRSFTESDVLRDAHSMKTCTEDWPQEKIDRMLKSSSNRAVNAIYERHISSNWKKINPYSTNADRVNWILAKYKAKLFVFPQKNTHISTPVDTSHGSSSSSRPSMDLCPDTTELPTRLLDFFVVVSLGEKISPADHKDVNSSVPARLEDLEFTPTVSSCFPEPESLPDTPLPEHLGMFIYPNGAHLSSTELPPTFFTFVLTDTSGVKLFGGVLHIYELVEPREVRAMLEDSPITSKVVYSPKALVVLSHYPFFHLFYNVLKQLYRISLSSCPLSMERYVAYVMQEVPLPPPGCTRVAFPLADSMLMVSRPPRNQLPVVDFSYRPLFTALSVKNILLVFSFICAEHKVCFASEYLSILTPVQESFQSFLFPLVWQGAYIPVMPANMLDLLDAPVPMLLGVERCQLFDGKSLKPYFGGGVVIVDLDRDEVFVGCDDFGKPLEPLHMHQKDVSKLKDKLVEFGGCVHKDRSSTEHLAEALKAFPQNEHLQPIQTFASLEDGVRIPFVTQYELDSGVSVQASYCFKDGEVSTPYVPILSPRSNTSSTDAFNAKEIRGAFLRFFVSSLRDMHSDNIRNETASSKESEVKKKKQKQKDQPEMTKFMTELMNTQMLTFFSEERVFHPDHAEVKFFDESILDKLNRSVTTVNKATTPFLDDKSEHIYELYFCLPCRADKHMSHVHTRFPNLSRAVKFHKRAKVLQLEAEHSRKHDTKNYLRVVDLARTANVEKATRRSSIGFLRKESSFLEVCLEGEAKFKLAMAAVLLIQRSWRSAIVRKHYWRKRAEAVYIRNATRSLDAHATTMQKIIRGRLSRLHIRKFRAARVIASIIRGFIKRRQYLRTHRGVVLVQSLLRMRVARKTFRKLIRQITKFKAVFGCRRTFRDIESKRIKAISSLRAVVFQLWALNNTQLEYRSQFWAFVDKTSFYNLAFHIDEIKTLWGMLKYDPILLKNLNYPQIFTSSLHNLEEFVASKYAAKPAVSSPGILAERKKFYTLMKSGIKDTTEQQKYFELFGIGRHKKRKQDLTNSLLWGQLEVADQSATVVLGILDIGMAEKESWVRRHNATRSGAVSTLSVLQSLMRMQRRQMGAELKRKNKCVS